MGLLLYAITTPPTAEPSPRIHHVDANGLTAWIRDVGAQPSPFTRRDLLEHHAELSDVFEHVEACLPARFPTVVADEAVLRRHLEQHAAELTQQLERMQGACEVAVTAVWRVVDEEALSVEATTPGRAYLLRRQAELSASERRRARAEELADALEREAGPRLRQAERHVCPSREIALSLALLVDRVSVHDVRERLKNVLSRDVRILVHGPWPPYTFVGVGLTSGKQT